MDVGPRIPRLFVSACLILSTAACASMRDPVTPAPWIPGSYDFEAFLEGARITGRIEVTDEGPMSVATGRGDCLTPAAPVWHPWLRTRTFSCPGHNMVVNLGGRVGPALHGTVGTTRVESVTQLVDTNRCLAYEGRFCVTWEQEARTVRKTVPVTSRFQLLAEGPSGAR